MTDLSRLLAQKQEDAALQAQQEGTGPSLAALQQFYDEVAQTMDSHWAERFRYEAVLTRIRTALLKVRGAL